MSQRKCCVPGCKSGSGKVLHLFPNPCKDKKLFNQWVSLIGGDIVGLRNDHIFNHRRVCHRHFEDKYFCRNNRISNIAVPTLYLPGSLSLPKFDLREPKLLKQTHTEGPSRFDDTNIFNDDNLHEMEHSKNIAALTSPVNIVYSWQQQRFATVVPGSKDPADTDMDLTELDSRPEPEPSAVPTLGDEDEDSVHEGLKCNHCHGDIVGFRYTCVQCADYDLCGACEARREHRRHYALRLPAPRPYAEIQKMLQAIRRALLLEHIAPIIGTSTKDDQLLEIKEGPDVDPFSEVQEPTETVQNRKAMIPITEHCHLFNKERPAVRKEQIKEESLICSFLTAGSEEQTVDANLDVALGNPLLNNTKCYKRAKTVKDTIVEEVTTTDKKASHREVLHVPNLTDISRTIDVHAEDKDTKDKNIDLKANHSTSLADVKAVDAILEKEPLKDKSMQKRLPETEYVATKQFSKIVCITDRKVVVLGTGKKLLIKSKPDAVPIPTKMESHVPKEVIKIKSSEVIKLKPSEVIKLKPSEVIKLKPSEVIKLKPSEVIKLKPSEVIKLKPSEVIKLRPSAKVVYDRKKMTLVHDDETDSAIAIRDDTSSAPRKRSAEFL